MTPDELYKLAKDINKIVATITKSREIKKWFNIAIEIETDECIIWPFAKSTNGYGEIWNGNKQVGVHVETAKIKLGECPSDKIVAHGPCNNPACFNYKHLSYKTTSENQKDRERDGTDRSGETSPTAKLTDKEVEYIRSVWPLVTLSMPAFAKIFKISHKQMWNILNNKQRVM